MKKGKIKIGLINSNKSQSKELIAIIDWFKNTKNINPIEITPEDLIHEGSLNKRFDTLWWHYDENVDLPEFVEDYRIKNNILKFINEGGGLLLSLLSAQYIYNLGIEGNPPDIIYKGKWDKVSWVTEYPDIRGFHSYLGHSIFNNLNNGVYTWNPQKDEDYCEVYYSKNNSPEKRKTAAVGRAYISFEENLRLINEYHYGKGKILTIGSYFFFSPKSKRFQSELRTFTLNCLEYLKDHDTSSINTYWHNEKFDLIPLPRKRTNFKIKKHDCNILENELKFSSKSTDNFFDLSGKRTLIMGRENGGISEIWFHPFRAIKEYNFCIIPSEGNPIKDNEIKSNILIQPEAIQREYRLNENKIQEQIFSALNLPGAVINYRCDLKDKSDLLINFKVDLRYMWPYSANILGPIKYYWDDGLRCMVITNFNEKFFINIGSEITPNEIIAGRYSSLELQNGQLIGNDCDEKHLLIGLRFKIVKKRSFTIVLSGSNIGKTESLRSYKLLMNNPNKYYREHYNHFKNLLTTSTIIETPDKEFNSGYKWALIGTDKFHADIPDLGKGFFAGYSNTTHGWGDGRPGYAWYFGRDSVWTTFAVLKYGDFEKVKDTIRFLGKYQNVDGKIFHEVTTSGCVHYDAADSTPLYIILCGYYLDATGDLEFVKAEWEHIKRAIDFCFSTDTDKDHLIENTNVGHGWIEGGKLYPIHAEIYLNACWAEALKESAKIAEILNLKDKKLFYEKEYNITRNIINNAFWNEDTNFYNVGKLQDETFNEEKTSLISVPILFGHCESEKVNKILNEFAGGNFSTDWGIRIIREDSKLFNPKGYHYGAIWPLFTGWVSLAEYKQTRGVQGFTHLMNNLSIYKHWTKGYIQEVINGEEYLPTGVCPHQAWSESMVLQPALEGMLGITSNVPGKEIRLRPNFPAHWDKVIVKNIKFGKELLKFSFNRTKDKYIYEFTKSGKSDFSVTFSPFLLKGITIRSIVVNRKSKLSKPIHCSNQEMTLLNFKLIDRVKIEIEYTGGVKILPYIPRVHIGGKSKGLRIINDEFKENKYKLLLEGKRENSYTFQVFSNNMKIKDIDGGEVISRNGSIYNIKIDFEDAKKKYYIKKVILMF
jgi:hypothetical protein